jgi:hypothetical protein
MSLTVRFIGIYSKRRVRGRGQRRNRRTPPRRWSQAEHDEYWCRVRELTVWVHFRLAAAGRQLFPPQFSEVKP